MPNIGNYYLDLQKLNLLEKEDKTYNYKIYYGSTTQKSI